MQREMLMDVKMHKAISVIQFKVEEPDYQKRIRDLSWKSAIYCIILIMKKER